MMGKAWSYIKRPFVNYAVEERASRVLNKEKPVMHPYHPTEERVMKQVQLEHPDVMKKIKEKDNVLNTYLKQVKVKSYDLLPNEPSSSRRLPSLPHSLDKMLAPVEDIKKKSMNKYGLPALPAEKIPPGKLSFYQAVELFQMTFNKDNLTEAQLAAKVEEYAEEHFKLKPEKTRIILKYFKPFCAAGNYERKTPESELEQSRHRKSTFSDVIRENEQTYVASEKARRESYERVRHLNKRSERLEQLKGENKDSGTKS